MNNIRSLITSNWNQILADEIQKDYFYKIESLIEKEKDSGVKIFPPEDKIFSAFNLVDFNSVRVVILGQDPYHGFGQANGFAFAVTNGQKVPPSLRNIFKEVASDLGVKSPTDPSLLGWANQGVLMLNSILTVRENEPASHREFGWNEFTDSVIKKLNDRKEPIVFVLWGAHAQQKECLITNKDHKVLSAPHPSPFSAYKGFFGCKHFSKINEILLSWGSLPISWERTGK